jgi:hypothetical protein
MGQETVLFRSPAPWVSCANAPGRLLMVSRTPGFGHARNVNWVALSAIWKSQSRRRELSFPVPSEIGTLRAKKDFDCLMLPRLLEAGPRLEALGRDLSAPELPSCSRLRRKPLTHSSSTRHNAPSLKTRRNPLPRIPFKTIDRWQRLFCQAKRITRDGGCLSPTSWAVATFKMAWASSVRTSREVEPN